MRLRCSVCKCYVRAWDTLLPEDDWDAYPEVVQPCKRCLRVVQDRIYNLWKADVRRNRKLYNRNYF
ncbi:unnamed protein product [marine sediment metagenome]|uniref:Uncharacterized protein n=1 Tax=marine sediment metagenome TaxID=412755 RepID=X1C4I0_9ZZZZ